MRPLIACREEMIAEFAALQGFPILPCNLCSSQAGELQRPAVRLLLQTLQGMNPTAGQNMLRACQDIQPSHLLDQSLREACGMDPVTGEIEDDEQAQLNA
jgi:tRNA 2-thiocytidine biosynthesis protein TtcA